MKILSWDLSDDITAIVTVVKTMNSQASDAISIYSSSYISLYSETKSKLACNQQV